MAIKLCNVKCNRCGFPFQRNIDKKFIRSDGSVTVSSYCNTCQKPRRKKYRGKTTAEIIDERSLQKCGVKIFSKKEIAQYENELNRR